MPRIALLFVLATVALAVAVAGSSSVAETTSVAEWKARGYQSVNEDLISQDTLAMGNHIVVIPRVRQYGVPHQPKSYAKKTVEEPIVYFNFLPRFMGTIYLTSNVIMFAGQCFNTTTAYLDADSTGGTVIFDARDKNDKLCSDHYMLADEEGFYHVSITDVGITKVTFPSWKSGEFNDLVASGFQVMLVYDGWTDTLNNLYATWDQLFGCGPDMFENNVKFLQEKMNFTYQKRPQNIVTLNTSDILSGMYLGIARLDGLDPMVMWGTGGHTGHTAMTMWDNGQLYVMESTANPSPLTCEYWPMPENVMKTPWDLWIQRAINASYLVTLFPLAPELQAKFDVDAALAFFNTVQGLPYGISNFIVGWIDTVSGNYPPPLSAQLVATFFALVDRINPTAAKIFYLDSMNFRMQLLGLQPCPDIECIVAELNTINMDFSELLTIPENDTWIYPDGKNMVCDVFVLSMYQAGGIFGDVKFQATEQTPKDSYMMNIYDGNWKRPAPCNVDNLPYCQILGEYLMELPYWNTIPPYNNMNERCNSMAPYYQRCPGYDPADTACVC